MAPQGLSSLCLKVAFIACKRKQRSRHVNALYDSGPTPRVCHFILEDGESWVALGRYKKTWELESTGNQFRIHFYSKESIPWRNIATYRNNQFSIPRFSLGRSTTTSDQMKQSSSLSLSLSLLSSSDLLSSSVCVVSPSSLEWLRQQLLPTHRRHSNERRRLLGAFEQSGGMQISD